MDVWEGEAFDLGDAHDRAFLAGLLAGRFVAHGVQCRVTHRIGHVRLPSGSELRIRSRKSPAAAVVAWMAYVDPALRALAFTGTPPGNAGEGDVGALVAALFARETLAVLTRHGLTRRYDRRSVTGSAVRGRIDFTRLAHRGGNLGKLPCVAWERLPETPLNRFLAAAVERIRRLPAMAEAARAWLPGLVGALAEVRPAVDEALLEGKTPLPRTEHAFEPACALARLVLRASTLGDGRAQSGAAFLVDIAALFERTVVAGFREAGARVVAKQPVAYEVLRPEGAPTSTEAMEMDLFVPGAVGGPVVVDAKFKAAVSSANLQQVVAYCAASGARRAVLVMPRRVGAQRVAYRFPMATGPGKPPDAIRVEEAELDTDCRTVEAWRRAAVAMARSVLAGSGPSDERIGG